MRRRLSVAMVLMVLAAVVLSGVFSLGFALHTTAVQTSKELTREAQGLAVSVRQEADSANRSDPARALRNVLIALRSPLRLDGSAVLAVRAGGQLFDPATPRMRPALPAGLRRADLHPATLLRLRPVSGRKGEVVYAAFPYRATIDILGRPRQVVQVVVLTRRLRPDPAADRTGGPAPKVGAGTRSPLGSAAPRPATSSSTAARYPPAATRSSWSGRRPKPARR